MGGLRRDIKRRVCVVPQPPTTCHTETTNACCSSLKHSKQPAAATRLFSSTAAAEIVYIVHALTRQNPKEKIIPRAFTLNMAHARALAYSNLPVMLTTREHRKCPQRTPPRYLFPLGDEAPMASVSYLSWVTDHTSHGRYHPRRPPLPSTAPGGSFFLRLNMPNTNLKFSQIKYKGRHGT